MIQALPLIFLRLLIFFNLNSLHPPHILTEMTKYPPALEQLITLLKLLPGVGTKTAERFAFQLLTWPDESLSQISSLLDTIKTQVPHCPTCFCLSSHEHGCEFCDSSRRDPSIICIIGSPKDAYAIEETHAYKG